VSTGRQSKDLAAFFIPKTKKEDLDKTIFSDIIYAVVRIAANASIF
jgi:hypothetical protein